MKSVRCYGRKQTTHIEKSFVREFFDGNPSVDYAWNDSSESDLFSSEDLYTANKENIKDCVLLSPVLFDTSKTEGTIKDSLIPEQKIFKKKKVKTKNIKAKPKKKVARKQICGPKTKQVKSIVSKFDKCNQPCWLDIQNHKFTVEKLCSKRMISRRLEHNNLSIRNCRIGSTALLELSPAITSSNVILSNSPTNSFLSQTNKNRVIVPEKHKGKKTKSAKIVGVTGPTEYSDGIHTDVSSQSVQNLYAADSSGDLFSNSVNYYRSTRCNSVTPQVTSNKPNKSIIPVHKMSKRKQGEFHIETSKLFNISKELYDNTSLKQKENLEYLTPVFKSKQNENMSSSRFLDKSNSKASPITVVPKDDFVGNISKCKNSLNKNSCTKIETAVQEIQKHKLFTVGFPIENNDSFKQHSQNTKSSNYSSSRSLNTSLDLFDECNNVQQNESNFETSKLITSVDFSTKAKESSNIETSAKQNGVSFEVSKLVNSISSPKEVTALSNIKKSDNPLKNQQSKVGSEATKSIAPASSSMKMKASSDIKTSNGKQNGVSFEVSKLVYSISSPKEVTDLSSIKKSDNPLKNLQSKISSEATKYISPASSSMKMRESSDIKTSNSKQNGVSFEVSKLVNSISSPKEATALSSIKKSDNLLKSQQSKISSEATKSIAPASSSRKMKESSDIKTSNSKQNGVSFEVSKLVNSISSPKKVTDLSSIKKSDNPVKNQESKVSSEAIKSLTPANSSKKMKDILSSEKDNSNFDYRQNEVVKTGSSSKLITSSSNKRADVSRIKISYNSLYYELVESITKKKSVISSPSLLHISQKMSFCEGKSANKFLTSTPMVCNSKKNIFNLLDDSFASVLDNKMKTLEDLTPAELIEHFDNDQKCGRSCLFPASEINLHNSSVSYKIKMPGNSHSLLSLNVSKQSSSRNSASSRSCMLNKSSAAASPNCDDELTRKKLLQLCNQDSVIPFLDAYDWSNSKIKKIGEGTYGEVFTICKGKSSSVLKIIPVSHSSDANSYQELKNVLSEVTIAKCLSELRNNKTNQTKNFNRLNKASIVSGLYPLQLIDAWDLFSKAKSTYNSRPDIFMDNQLFVILELEYGGKDLSCFVLRNAVEAESIIKQVAVSLAIAEEEFLFEHRDLHLGNILVQRNRSKNISYKLRGKDLSFETNGVLVTIIDFTLSRLHDDGYIYYNDLAEDVSLFNQSGDYQFEIYRAMKEKLSNEWHESSLYSNVLWLKYLCVKLEECEYSRPSTLAHKKGLEAIGNFKNYLLPCDSALDCLTRCGIAKEHFERKPLQDSKLTKKSILISRNSFQKSKQSICM